MQIPQHDDAHVHQIEPAGSHLIPSSNTLIAIEHPAILSSIDAGVRSLGGPAALTKAVEDHDNAILELRYRPDDIYQHPIISQSISARNIVIKIRKNIRTGEIEQIEPVGIVDRIIRFRGQLACLKLIVDIADFQYHPYPDSKFANKFEEAFAGLNYEKLSKFEISTEDDDIANLDLMPPPTFSSTNIAQVYNYKQNSGLIMSDGRLICRNSYRNKFITMVEKDIPSIPAAPSSNLDPLTKTIQSLQICVKRLSKLFTERPISTRRAIFNTYLQVHGAGNPESQKDNWRPILRYALPYVCYMFKSGPFRDAYVVFGVDPRKDSKWAKYQTAIFNFRTGKWRTKEAVEEAKDIWESRNSHLFTGKDVNTKVVSYSFADITDPVLRKLLDESPLRDKFHENDGWYPVETLFKVKKIMRQKLLALRQGRVPSDEEFLPTLNDTNIDTTHLREEPDASVPPEEMAEEDSEGEDDDEVEGESLKEDNPSDAQLEHIVANVIRQAKEHEITSLNKPRKRARRSKQGSENDSHDSGGEI